MKYLALVGAVAAVTLAAGCGGVEQSAGVGGSSEDDVLTVQEAVDAGSGRIAVRGTIITSVDEIRLCSAILESYPPQCGQPSLRIEGLDLDAVSDLQRAEGVAWTNGEVTVAARLDHGVLRASRIASLGSPGGAGAGDPDRLDAPEGYRAVLGPATWALERVAPDGNTIWIRVAKSGCNDFHHAEVTEAPDGVRVVVFDRVLIPVGKNRGCLLYLIAARHRVQLPRPLGTQEIVGECVPGDSTAEQRICATMHEAASHR